VVAAAFVAPGNVHRHDARWSRATPEEPGRAAKHSGTQQETVALSIEEPPQGGEGVFQTRHSAEDRAVIEGHDNAAAVLAEDTSQTRGFARLAWRRYGVEIGHPGSLARAAASRQSRCHAIVSQSHGSAVCRALLVSLAPFLELATSPETPVDLMVPLLLRSPLGRDRAPQR
jgi:hypothetical protein